MTKLQNNFLNCNDLVIAMDLDDEFTDEFHFEPTYSFGIELSQSSKITTSIQMLQTSEILLSKFDENLFDDDFQFPEPSYSLEIQLLSRSTTAAVYVVPGINRPTQTSINAISSSTKFDLFIADQKTKSTVYK